MIKFTSQQEALAVAVEQHRKLDPIGLAMAEDIYRSILKVIPEDADALHLLGRIALHKEYYKEARALAVRMLQTGDRLISEGYMLLGQASIYAGQVLSLFTCIFTLQCLNTFSRRCTPFVE